ncbi:hypothetical protein IQ219_07905 [Synechocystis sp. LEGE 06083]|uniref:hypothetical protein n=1 Tax=Synechocystis sp. LEGE 06083 TaxID=915336 RepID=UPI0018812774|nr:hypothetical protein [Synechocystis sp. LEGE 06083]MBE9195232.1 hypothetical protein [Synechocystis sp. LEGE 06083]
MKEGGIGGASTATGLSFEKKVDFCSLIEKIPGYSIKNATDSRGKTKPWSAIYFEDKLVANSFKKNNFYKYLLYEHDIHWENFLSAKLLPDDALLVIIRETLFIIEVKFQQVQGSVDEKLQTCDFKRKQYLKLVSPIGLKVEYVYVLNDWFKQERYKDVLDYIHSVNCHYKFHELPLAWLGLPKAI